MEENAVSNTLNLLVKFYVALMFISVMFFFARQGYKLISTTPEEREAERIEQEAKRIEATDPEDILASEADKKAKMLKEGYTCYKDGQKVDLDTIDLSLYNYKVSNKEKRVYITEKDNSGSGWGWGFFSGFTLRGLTGK